MLFWLLKMILKIFPTDTSKMTSQILEQHQQGATKRPSDCEAENDNKSGKKRKVVSDEIVDSSTDSNSTDSSGDEIEATQQQVPLGAEIDGQSRNEDTTDGPRREVWNPYVNIPYLSNTPTNLCIALLNFLLFYFVLYCYAFVQYCYLKSIQYNAMHKFVGALDNPLFIGIIKFVFQF